MKIWYDDIVYSLQRAGGISVMWSHITDQSLYPSCHIKYKNAESNPCSKIIDGHHYEIQEHKQLTLKRYMNPSVAGVKEPFLFHSSYYRYCTNKNAINITTVYDFIYEYCRHDFKSRLHKMQKKNTVLHSDGVICISESTKRDLVKFYPEYKGLTAFVHCGYDTDMYYYTETEKEEIVLSVGARESYKRFDLTVGLLKALPDCRLIIVGGGNLTKQEKDMLEKEIPGRYEKSGYLTNDELRDLYNRAFFLSYCSDYEGFGIPPIEAQACGCPVVCQPKSSIPEVVGKSAVFVDSDRMSESIQSVKKLYDQNFYKEIVYKGLENVKRFSWNKCRDEVLAFYKEVLDSKR